MALAALLPLFLAVTYAGRYTDIQQSAVQASRYAAYERSVIPTASLSDDTLRDQMRARFFMYGGRHNGMLRSDDTATAPAASDTSPIWKALDGTALIGNVNSDVTLNFDTASLGSVVHEVGYMASTAGKTFNDAKLSRVEVTMLNKMDLRTSAPGPLRVAGSTAMAADGLGSHGSTDTRDSAATIVPVLPGLATTGLNFIMGIFEPTELHIGCIKPDVVAHDRLEPFSGIGPCM